MNGKFEYAIVQLADRDRGERLNAALAIFSPNGLDVRMPKRLEKLKALSAALDLDRVRTAVCQLTHFDRSLREDGLLEIADRIDALGALSPLILTDTSFFNAPSHAAYEDWAAKLLKALVEPEPARIKPIRKRSRLITIMKSAFRSERVLAKPGEDLTDHRILTNVTIAEGLSADFVLKNGAMHVIETVDASEDEFTPRKIVSDIAVSALVLEQARMTFGERGTHSRLVYDASASAERIAMPSLKAAAHQGTELINWASQDDRNRLILDLAGMATPYEKRNPRRGDTNIHASTQHKLNLH